MRTFQDWCAAILVGIGILAIGIGIQLWLMERRAR